MAVQEGEVIEVNAHKKLLKLFKETDKNLDKYEGLILRELFNSENENAKVDAEKKELCWKLAKYAWKAVNNQRKKMSFIAITTAIEQIYKNLKAVEIYGQFLCEIIEQLCIVQGKEINENIQNADSKLLASSWYKHVANVQFILDSFVPNNIQGNGLREILKRSATASYRKYVLIGSELHADVLHRFESGQMTRDEQISAIQILNVIDGQFFDAHLNSTLVKLTQLTEQTLKDGYSTADLIFEAVYWLELEMKAFGIISSDGPQTFFFAKSIRDHVVKNLLAGHLKDNFSALVTRKDFDAISQLYILFQSVEDGIDELLKLVGTFVSQHKITRQTASKTAVGGSPKSPNRIPHSVLVINDFLEFKSLLFNSILNDCFHGDRRFRERIEAELNRLVLAHDHFEQYLAFYIDYQLKRRQHEEVAKAAALLPYVGNKESFEQFYRGHLAARLINGLPSDLTSEKLLIDNFKAGNGNTYTRKMEKMISDVGASRELLGEFVQTLTPGAIVNLINAPPPIVHDIQFTATVLTENQWPPHYRPTACRLPLQVEELFASFEKFYSTKYNNRKLHLNVGAGSAVITARFFGPEALQKTRTQISNNDSSLVDLDKVSNVIKKTLIVTSFQMAIFDLFNTRSFITVKDLLSLGLSVKALQRSISPAIQLHVLCRQGDATPSFLPESTDVYYINDEFRSKKSTINLRK